MEGRMVNVLSKRGKIRRLPSQCIIGIFVCVEAMHALFQVSCTISTLYTLCLYGKATQSQNNINEKLNNGSLFVDEMEVVIILYESALEVAPSS